jgi:hypothetical protein
MRRWVSARCSALLAAEILGIQTLYRDVSANTPPILWARS